MLIEFTVGNFKSFRDKTTFSMIAAPLKSEDPALDHNNVIPVNKRLNLLRSVALYGANSSGKSNLGAAMRFMREFVLFSSSESRSSAQIDVEPFLFSTENHNKPSFFEIVFIAEDRQYRYGFEVDATHIVSEWLFHVPTTKEIPLYLREGQEITIKPGFKEGKALEERTKPNSLFLSVAAAFNGKIAQRIVHWFNFSTITTGLQDDYRAFTMQWLRDDKQQPKLMQFLRELNLGFYEVQIPKLNALKIWPDKWPEDVRYSLNDIFPSRISTVHPVFDKNGNVESQHLLNLDVHESQGTRKLFALAGLLLAHIDMGKPVFIDELDARLHPLMTRHIIDLFHSDKSNNAQLIFATHDTNILDRTLFRRDQIWFAEKDRQGATHLYSLADFRPRNDAAFEKNYLAGRYGAIPFLGDVSHLPPVPPAQEQDEKRETETAHA